MNTVTKKLYLYFLPKLIKSKCNERIPRSGEAGKKTNCYLVRLDKGSDPYLWLEDLVGENLNCLEWDGSSYSRNVSVKLDEIYSKSLVIIHFYGLYEIRYSGIYDYIIGRYTYYQYLKINLQKLVDHTLQYLFNKRSLETKQRFDLLKLLVKNYSGRGNGFGYVEVMSYLYSNRSFLHPQFDSKAKQILSFLDGLVDTKELKLIDHNYHLTGHAYKAIDEFEEQDRKHRSANFTQWIMALLTLALVFLTMAQAGLIKLPLLINLS